MVSVEAFLKALPAIASSPLGFTAFVIVIVAWLLVVLRVHRNRQVLERLKDFPEKDRLEALRVEMGVVKVKSGLTPEQWLRSRIHFYMFAAVGVSVLALVVMFVVARTTVPRGTLQIDVTGAVAPDAVEQRTAVPTQSIDDGIVRVVNTYDGSGYSDADYNESPYEHTLEYDYQPSANGVRVRPRMAYLDLLKRGGPILPTISPEFLFKWQFPMLSIKVANNSPHTSLLSAIQIEVRKSTVNQDPVLGFDSDQKNSFVFWNDGWGKALAVEVHFAVKPEGVTTWNSPEPDAIKVVRLGDVEQYSPEIVLATCPGSSGADTPPPRMTDLVPASLLQAENVTLVGTVRFRTETGTARSLRFVAPVHLACDGGMGAGAPPTFYYHVKLDAGRAGVKKTIPISQEIKPGEVDHFTLRIASDKSAAYDLVLRVLDVGGNTVLEKAIDMDIYIPRAGSQIVAPAAAKVRFNGQD